MEGLNEQSKYKKIVMQFREALSATSQLREDFREYDDYYLAKHWNEQRASWRPNPVVNYIAYVVDQKAPQLTQQRPSGLILPTAADDEEAAKLFTQITDVVADRVDLDSKVEEVVRTGLLLGTAFMKVYWDNSLSGGNKGKGNLWKGDIAIDCPDPSNIFPDSAANSIEECRYIIYAVPKTTKWIEERFKVKVDPEQAFETEIYNRPSVDNAKDRVMFYEYWYREGGKINCIYAAGGKILKEIKSVYKHGRFPFVAFVAKKNRKSLWGIGEPKNLLSNQKLLNKLMEMMTTNALLTSNPIALIDPRSGIDPKKWVNKPGQIWMAKDPGAAVRWLDPPRLSNDVPQTMERLVEFIEKIGGIYDSVTGETPGAVTAAAAIQMLQEQGSIPIKGIARNLYQTMKDVYELMIELIKENYSETRLIRIVDEDGTMEFKEFKGIEYAEIDFDIKVSGGASTPTSKAYIAQLAADLFAQGVLLPSEYVEMQEGLPNKDRIVARLREQEQAPPPQEQGPPQGPPPGDMMPPDMMGPPPGMMPPQGMMQGPPPGPPNIDEMLPSMPPELQEMVMMMREQGAPDEAIIQQLLQMG